MGKKISPSVSLVSHQRAEVPKQIAIAMPTFKRQYHNYPGRPGIGIQPGKPGVILCKCLSCCAITNQLFQIRFSTYETDAPTWHHNKGGVSQTLARLPSICIARQTRGVVMSLSYAIAATGRYW